MKNRVVIRPYKRGLKSIRGFKELLGEKLLVLRPDNTIYVKKPTDLYVNWGNSTEGEYDLNPRIKEVTNKRRFFRLIKPRYPNDILEFTTDYSEACEWVSGGSLLVARWSLTGNSGRGIDFVGDIENFKECPLFTKYFPKKEEFRCHFIRDKPFFWQRKARKYHELDSYDWKVRNFDNGFVFEQNNFIVPRCVNEVSVKISRYLITLGVDFGAIDILYNERKDQAKVCEVNSAPALEGRTLEHYATSLCQLMIT